MRQDLAALWAEIIQSSVAIFAFPYVKCIRKPVQLIISFHLALRPATKSPSQLRRCLAMFTNDSSLESKIGDEPTNFASTATIRSAARPSP